MSDAAAFCASRITLSIAGLRVTMSLTVTTPPRLCARFWSAPSASTLSALAIDMRRRSGEAGLTTKSKAPLRMADTTVSMPPCAVWTMTGMSISRSRMALSTPMPSSPGMARSSTTAAIPPPEAASSAASAVSPPSASTAS